LLKIPPLPVTVYLVTPPFTQLNTPYPATAYLKGFLNTKGISAYQSDLGIEVTTRIFSEQGLTQVFSNIEKNNLALSANAERIISLKDFYLQTIDNVISFLQGKNPTLAHRIAKRNFLPEASRFAQLADLDWAFGSMGVQDQAKHIATLYLEDLSDLIQENLDEHFGFSRYAEKLGRSANTFDDLYNALQQPYTFTDHFLLAILQERITEYSPKLVALSVPFPGNLYAALRCGQWMKAHHPEIRICLGGGYPNTELRSVTDTRIFEFADFITLDDGEAPVECLVEFIEGKRTVDKLKRTFLLMNDALSYINNKEVCDYKQSELGTPDYSDLFLDTYISAIEILNPMHRLWSDGRWNKLTMAHGCYWGKCTFCDISLDYIKLYEPVAANILCDRMEEMIRQTGVNGFHFVDEAAPPALMRALAIEILKRKIVVSWWTNIRFEKSFTRDLCLLLKASGCIGVSGGLEVASDRLLELIQKGITVSQVAKVNKHFTEAGIMVHAYLMYGFPSQTTQETIDSLEMVRQMFATGILQSAYWHLFTMTAHSPVGLEPEKFNVRKKTKGVGSFANNDLEHEDPTGADHEIFGYGLKKSLLNFMHGHGLDYPLQKWFDFPIPKTSIAPNYILTSLEEEEYHNTKQGAKWIWIGKTPALTFQSKSKKGQHWEMAVLTFQTLTDKLEIKTDKEKGIWLANFLTSLSELNNKIISHQQILESYAAAGFEDFELFWDNKPVNTLYKAGLLRL
jgi:radical SAM superfamily enzyme YgiQ (UPF0313 family)